MSQTQTVKTVCRCKCSLSSSFDPWYNPRDYCENCQKEENSRCDLELRSTNSNIQLKPPRKRKQRPSVICTSNCRYDIVRNVAEVCGLKEGGDGWNVFWTDLSLTHDRCKDMKRYQRINHFPGMLEICRKDLLARNLNRMLKLFPNDYNFFPRSWCLHTELNEVLEYSKTHRNKPLILKPDIGCQGRGIFITKNLNDLRDLDRMICQVYITKPFLIDGYKFDLRVYVLITSCDPLRIYVYNEGLVRFATKRYKEPSVSNLNNTFMHLTNYSVNKHSRAYVHDAEGGSKRRISTINHMLMDAMYNTERLWKAVDDVIVKTIIVALPSLKHSYQTCFPNHVGTLACFEILGFDFILDNKLHPILLEVNHSPSFHTETDIDHDVKESLLNDTFKLLNLTQNEKHKILSEDKKRIKDRLLGTGDKKHLSDKYEERSRIHESSLKNIFQWENSHLGNFRQAYPSECDEKYAPFLEVNYSTLYNETHSSKAREMAAKIQRDDLQTKQDKLAKVKMNKERKNKNIPIKRSDINNLSPYDPVLINDFEEEERLADLKKREIILSNHGVLEKIYKGFREAGLLQLEDQIRYGRKNNWTVNPMKNKEVRKYADPKKQYQDVFRLLSKRGLFLSSQEIPLTNTLIQMSGEDDEVLFEKKKKSRRNTIYGLIHKLKRNYLKKTIKSLQSEYEVFEKGLDSSKRTLINDLIQLTKKESITKLAPPNTPQVPLSKTASIESHDVTKKDNDKPTAIDGKETEDHSFEIVEANIEKEETVKDNEVIVKGVKITCSEAVLNEEPWILIRTQSCN